MSTAAKNARAKFEELVFDDAAPVCPNCGSRETHKLMSRCAHCTGGSDGGEYAAPSSGGGGGCARMLRRQLRQLRTLNPTRAAPDKTDTDIALP